MKKQDIIKQIVDEFTPVEYPELYSREQMEEAVRKALEHNEKKVKKLQKEVSDAGWRYEYDHCNDWRKPIEMGQL